MNFAQPEVFIPQLELVLVPQIRRELPWVILGQGQAWAASKDQWFVKAFFVHHLFQREIGKL